MAILLEIKERNVVPRWRDFKTTVQLGELGTQPSRVIDKTVDLSPLVTTWETNHGLTVAGDLISAALVNNLPEVARQASTFVINAGQEASLSLRRMAAHVLGRPDLVAELPSNEPPVVSPETSRLPSPAIANARAELGARPANPVLWMDLAYLYAIRGMAVKADKAVKAALQLAPANRFILRSAARFLVHQNKSDEAHALVRRAPGVKNDPWLLSAEIALSMAAQNRPFFAKEGLSMAGSANFSNHQLSELRSAVGTLEASHGSNHKAKKHIRNSLLDATDNSLAQATWLGQYVGGLSLDLSEINYEIDRPYEANTYRAFIVKEWQESFNASLRWISDQPFSSRAVRSAAYLANSIFLDHDLAEKLIKFGQIANPDEPAFHVGLAYA